MSNDELLFGEEFAFDVFATSGSHLPADGSKEYERLGSEDSDESTRQLPLIIRDRYHVGIARNRRMVMARLFADDVLGMMQERLQSDPGLASLLGGQYLSGLELQLNSTRIRGDECGELTEYIYLNESNIKLSEKLRAARKTEKQGTSTFHDLGLAHAAYYLLIRYFSRNPAHQPSRNSTDISTSIWLGRLIQPTRVLAHEVYKRFPTRSMYDISVQEILKKAPRATQDLCRLLAELRDRRTALTQLRRIRLGVLPMLRVYADLKTLRLDDRPYDHFLAE
jgi:hypothetical protein